MLGIGPGTLSFFGAFYCLTWPVTLKTVLIIHMNSKLFNPAPWSMDYTDSFPFPLSWEQPQCCWDTHTYLAQTLLNSDGSFYIRTQRKSCFLLLLLLARRFSRMSTYTWDIGLGLQTQCKWTQASQLALENLNSQKENKNGWCLGLEKGPAFKSTCGSYQRQEFSSQHP